MCAINRSAFCDQAAPIALTVTPAASRPARRRAANTAAPGVSPWTQIVSAPSSATVGPVDRVDHSLLHHPHGTSDSDGRIGDDGVRLGARSQRAVRLVGAIGKDLRRHAKTGGAPCLQQFGAGKAKQHQRSVEGGDRPGDGRREHGVADGHVEQRAMRLDVLERDAVGGGNAGDGGNLVEHEVLGLVRRRRSVRGGRNRRGRESQGGRQRRRRATPRA